MSRAQPPFRCITLIGVGLIGGSLGLAIKRKFPSIRILGVDTPAVLERARKRGAIDQAVRISKGTVQRSDLIVLCTPVSAILRILPRVARYCLDSTIVTDVGSVKSAVTKLGARLFPGGNFVGGHPMAGTEHSGIDAAQPGLFERGVWVLTPVPGMNDSGWRKLRGFLQRLGARVKTLDARTHDEVVSVLSHVPQLISVALLNVVGKKHAKGRKHLNLAGGGFNDMTRIASSGFHIWSDILSENKRE
ncbi:MAG TPA: prephenate dehydrogenase/arogenate dehydrogenase family protein, partial [Bacteroidota bacterium]|nr:prephenate dehydrogenase/arogenate dehydrogenase family protein [Bacteroidota bacterium]